MNKEHGENGAAALLHNSKDPNITVMTPAITSLILKLSFPVCTVEDSLTLSCWMCETDNEADSSDNTQRELHFLPR